MIIYQGQNEPLRFKFPQGLEGSTSFSAVLKKGRHELKKWTSYTSSDGVLSLPLVESETMTYPEGDAVLEAKYSKDGQVHLFAPVHVLVIDRENKYIIGG